MTLRDQLQRREIDPADLCDDELADVLDDGIIERPRRWSGDTHDDLGGTDDVEITDRVMAEAAKRFREPRHDFCNTCGMMRRVSTPEDRARARHWAERMHAWLGSDPNRRTKVTVYPEGQS